MDARTLCSGLSNSNLPSAWDGNLALSHQLSALDSCQKPLLSGSRDRSSTATCLNEADSLAFPSPDKIRAIALLRDFEDEEVVAWLKLLRCLKPDYQHLSPSSNTSGEQLTPNQLNALSALKACPEEVVLAWLRNSRLCGWSQVVVYLLR